MEEEREKEKVYKVIIFNDVCVCIRKTQRIKTHKLNGEKQIIII